MTPDEHKEAMKNANPYQCWLRRNAKRQASYEARLAVGYKMEVARLAGRDEEAKTLSNEILMLGANK